MLHSPQKVRVERKTYWQLAGFFLLFVSLFMFWLSIKTGNSEFSSEATSERSLFTGMMYLVEHEHDANGVRNDYYSFVADTKHVERILHNEEERFELRSAESKIHSIIRKEGLIIFSSLLMIYIWISWMLLRKYGDEVKISGPIYSSLFCLYTIWQTWGDIQQNAEDVMMYVSRL
ncbi:hypothetical protein [Brevibacillus choshinensis]|uniref:hypothetical protein n=1 Tax=Brevibacillus choshinensis TaxID=54911 RepID=UPI002E1E8AB0|nr:hypothetical protein [Brevibacillus choshinensis]